MLNHLTALDSLRAQASQGEIKAAQALVDQVAPRMIRIVRRVIRTREVQTTLDRRILLEAQRALEQMTQQGQGNNRELLIERVAENLCQRIYQRANRGETPTTNFTPEDTTRLI